MCSQYVNLQLGVLIKPQNEFEFDPGNGSNSNMTAPMEHDVAPTEEATAGKEEEL